MGNCFFHTVPLLLLILFSCNKVVYMQKTEKTTKNR